MAGGGVVCAGIRGRSTARLTKIARSGLVTSALLHIASPANN